MIQTLKILMGNYIKQKCKIEDFENWIKEKEPIDSIESDFKKT